MATEIRMPKLTQTMDQGRVVEWLRAEGESVNAGEPLVVIETDKAAVDVEAPANGVLSGVVLAAGQTADIGSLLAYLTGPEDDSAAHGAKPSLANYGPTEPGKVRAMPAARRVARELGVELSQVRGTGPEECVLRADVERFAAGLTQAQRTEEAPSAGRVARATPLARKLADELGLPIHQASAGPGGRIGRAEVQNAVRTSLESAGDAPYDTAGLKGISQSEATSTETGAPSPSPTGYRDEEPSRIGRSMAERMASSWTTAPHFYLEAEVDMTEVGRLREMLGAKLGGQKPSYTALIVQVVARTLRDQPRVNVCFSAGNVRLLDDVNVGVAVASPDGLIVPVVRRADTKNLTEISRELDELRGKAERLRFKPEELSGGTFTVSNLGMFGIDRFHAILNPPEAAILACGRISKRVVEAEDGVFESRPMMCLVLSVDHRVLDGATAARFLGAVRECIENPYLLL